jgi:uncharacterized protein
MTKDFILETKKNNLLRITASGLENIFNSPCIIIVHGFKGFKDWGFFPYVADYFAKKNYFVIAFNFSHNGIGENLTEFTELDKFSKNTFSLELEELSEIIHAYSNGYFGKAANNKIGLLGHSRGGGISILTAAKNQSVASAAVWASVAYFDRYSERQKAKWKTEGFFDVLNTRTNQVMRLDKILLEDIENNKTDLLNIDKASAELNKPLLIAHGEQDLAVPVKEAEQLYSRANKELTELFIIPSTGHTFNVQHPFEGTNEKLEILLEKTEKFFNTNLN